MHVHRAAVAVAISSLGTACFAEPIVLRAERMLDVRGGAIVRDAVVVVDGELIDAHTHLTVGTAGEVLEPWERMSMGPIDMALQAAANARATLQAGFTTVREAGANDFIDVSLRRAVERGILAGPRIVPSGYQISPTGGHGDNVGFPAGQLELTPEQGIADGPERLLRAVRYQIRQGAQVIKLTATAGVLGLEATADAPQFTQEEQHRRGRRRHGRDAGGHPGEGCLHHRSRQGEPRERHPRRRQDRPRHRRGDLPPRPQRARARRPRRARHGAPGGDPVDDRGALEPGLLADVIAVPGDPLKNVTALERVDFVMRGGEIVRWPDLWTQSLVGGQSSQEP